MAYSPLRYLPDCDDVILAILGAGGIACGANIPADLLDRLPYVSAKRFGGSAVDPQFLDRATYSVDAWAAGRRAAADLAETCRVLLFTAWRSQRLYAGASVAHFAEVTAPAELRTDGQASGLDRYQASYTLHVRPQ